MLQSYLERRSPGGISLRTFGDFIVYPGHGHEHIFTFITFFPVPIVDGYSQASILTSEGFELSRESRAQADIKFTYVVSCQIYGQQKQRKAPEAADISLLLQRY